MKNLKDALNRYVNDRIRTGSFLEACLKNNLGDAMARADFQNKTRMKEIMEMIYMEVPGFTWGSTEAVERWLKGGEKSFNKDSLLAHCQEDFDWLEKSDRNKESFTEDLEKFPTTKQMGYVLQRGEGTTTLLLVATIWFSRRGKGENLNELIAEDCSYKIMRVEWFFRMIRSMCRDEVVPHHPCHEENQEIIKKMIREKK